MNNSTIYTVRRPISRDNQDLSQGVVISSHWSPNAAVVSANSHYVADKARGVSNPEYYVWSTVYHPR